MSIHRRAARRDSNEVAIVAALTAAGASVTHLSAPGVPDLLVGIGGRTYLLEVKAPLGPKGGKHANSGSLESRGGDGTHTRDQLAWRAGWRGAPAITVRTPAEALAAIHRQSDRDPIEVAAEALDEMAAVYVEMVEVEIESTLPGAP